MPECTYIDEDQRKNLISVEDEYVNELFQEVRKKFNNQYLLKEFEEVIPRFLRKPKKVVYYQLYGVINRIEVQVINFGKRPIKTDIINYFYGLLNGYEFCKRQQTKKTDDVVNDLFMSWNIL